MVRLCLSSPLPPYPNAVTHLPKVVICPANIFTNMFEKGLELLFSSVTIKALSNFYYAAAWKCGLT